MKDRPLYIKNKYPEVRRLTARDYSKEKIGKLTPLYRTKNSGTKGKSITWLTRCDCGEYLAVKADNLKSGKVKSCKACELEGYNTWRQEGVPQWVLEKYPEIPIGQAAERHGDRFGKLTAIYRTTPANEPNWLCRCDCGNYEVVHIGYLVKRVQGTCNVCYGKSSDFVYRHKN